MTFGAVRNTLNGDYRSPNGIKFNGTDNGLVINSALTGTADAINSIVLSYWYLLTSVPGSTRVFSSGQTTGDDLAAGIGSTGAMNIYYFDAAGANGMTWNATGTTYNVVDGKWHHVLAYLNSTGTSATQDAAARWYFDDVSVPRPAATVTGTPTNLVLDLASAYTSIGYQGTTAPARFFPGLVAEVWYDVGIVLDFDDVGLRRKFIDSRGRPAYLGGFGERPTGKQPLIYLPGGAQGVFGLNRGTGGLFSATATPAQSNSSPSDSFGVI